MQSHNMKPKISPQLLIYYIYWAENILKLLEVTCGTGLQLYPWVNISIMAARRIFTGAANLLRAPPPLSCPGIELEGILPSCQVARLPYPIINIIFFVVVIVIMIIIHEDTVAIIRCIQLKGNLPSCLLDHQPSSMCSVHCHHCHHHP